MIDWIDSFIHSTMQYCDPPPMVKVMFMFAVRRAVVQRRRLRVSNTYYITGSVPVMYACVQCITFMRVSSL